MAENGASEREEVIKATALETTPERSRMAYYAVAHEENPGIRERW
jgi:hypothetical protein